jgi:septal ring factor EnvC (AmiA/AmiB activator)
MKNAMLPVAIGVAVLGLVLAVYANTNSGGLKAVLDQERSKRFAAEQQLLKAQQKVDSLEVELGEVTSKMSSIEKILTDGRQTEKVLLQELEAVKKEREALIEQTAATEQ